jgi:hypothetical protein
MVRSITAIAPTTAVPTSTTQPAIAPTTDVAASVAVPSSSAAPASTTPTTVAEHGPLELVAAHADFVDDYGSEVSVTIRRNYCLDGCTSMSAPTVPGVAVLVRSAHPDLGAVEVASPPRSRVRTFSDRD